MKLNLRTDWAPLEELPHFAKVLTPATSRRSQKQTKNVGPPGTGSETEKHLQCSKALWSLCHGGTIAEAAAYSGLSESHVSEIFNNYGINHLVTNAKHQQNDNMQIGPWIHSRLFQSGYERYKNDFHSWNFLWAMGLSVDEACFALENWPEFKGIQARLMRDYPSTWQKFARKDIDRCYRKFAEYRGHALVKKRTLTMVAKAVLSLNQAKFTMKELLPLLKLSRRQIQRALGQIPTLRKAGAKRGTRWEVVTPMTFDDKDASIPDNLVGKEILV